MTTTDPASHSEGHLDTPQHADTSADDTFLDYAAREYTELAARVERMPMDVRIAATLGAAYEVRALRDGVELLTAAIRDLEAVFADTTATIRAALAEVERPPAKFGLEESEAAVRVVEGAGG